MATPTSVRPQGRGRYVTGPSLPDGGLVSWAAPLLTLHFYVTLDKVHGRSQRASHLSSSKGHQEQSQQSKPG